MDDNITITVNRNMLGQLLDSCGARLEEMEEDIRTLDADVTEDIKKDQEWLSKCLEHVQGEYNRVILDSI